MKFGYTIIYVANVLSSLTFFEMAFGFKKKFIDKSGDYGQLDTEETTLSFPTHSLGASNFPNGYISADSSDQPLGVEIALTTDSVEMVHQQAIAAGGIGSG